MKFLSYIQRSLISVKSADQSITATVDTDVTDLAVTIAVVGKYSFSMFANVSATGTSPTARWRMTGPTANPIVYSVSYNTGASGATTLQQVAGWGANTGTQAIPASTVVGCIIQGYANITATGTLKLQVAAAGTTPNLSIKQNSVLIVERIA